MERDASASANSYEEIMDWLTDGIISEADIRPYVFTELVSETKPIDNQILEDARKQIEAKRVSAMSTKRFKRQYATSSGSIVMKAERGHGKSGQSVNLSG